MKTLKIQAYEAGKLRLEEAELSPAGENEVTIETHYSSISPGTELAWVYHLENTPGKFPFYPGYSNCGKIIAVGDKVTGFKIGDSVAAPVSHWSHINANANDCVLLPNDMDLKEASPYKVAAVAMHGINRAKVEIGDSVAVVGLGPIGNVAAQIALNVGTKEVFGFDLVESRRIVAEKCGIKNTAADGTLEAYDSRFNVVIEVTGNPQAIKTAMKLVAKAGKVILLGSSRGVTENVDFYKDVHCKGCAIIGAHTWAPCPYYNTNVQERQKIECEMTIQMLKEKKITFNPLISEVFEPKNAQSMYDRLMARNEPLLLAAYKWK